MSSGELFPVETRGRKKPSGPQADCIRIWEEEWLRSRGMKWAWTSKHAANVAQALRLAGTVEEFGLRAKNLLGSSEPFLKKAASPGVLVMHWNDPAVARRPPRIPSRPSLQKPSEKPSAILPEGWGARMADALRSRDGRETVLRELSGPRSTEGSAGSTSG